MAPLAGRPLCFNHDPERARDRATARRRGGARSRPGKSATSAAVGSVVDLQAVLGRVLSDILALENSNQRGRTAASLLLTGAKLLETGELEARLRVLEQRAADVDGRMTAGRVPA